MESNQVDSFDFQFGMDNEVVCTRLETIAADIRAGLIAPQTFSETVTNNPNDWRLRSFSLVFALKELR